MLGGNAARLYGFDTGALAPLVFEAAVGGDAICQAILVDAGQSLAHAAIVVARQLFALDDAVPIFPALPSRWRPESGRGRLVVFESHLLVGERVHTLCEAKLLVLGEDGVLSPEATREACARWITDPLPVQNWHVSPA